MKLNNKGEVFLTLATIPGVIHLIGVGILVAAVWHVPAWTKAKKEGTTAQYQAQKMWPQEVFAKLPGGDNYKGRANDVSVAPNVEEIAVALAGNGGNFVGGNSNPDY